MSEKPVPLFLERRSYRQRRLMDAARLLPLLAAVLWVVPLLWPKGAQEGTATSTAILYLFGTWLGLAVLAFLISRRLVDEGDSGPQGGGDAQ